MLGCCAAAVLRCCSAAVRAVRSVRARGGAVRARPVNSEAFKLQAAALYRARWLASRSTSGPQGASLAGTPQQEAAQEARRLELIEPELPAKKRRLSSQLKWTPSGSPVHTYTPVPAATATATPAEDEAVLAVVAALPPRAPASKYAEDTIKVGCDHRRARLQP